MGGIVTVRRLSVLCTSPRGLLRHEIRCLSHTHEENCREVPRLIESSLASPARISTTEDANGRGSDSRPPAIVITARTRAFFATKMTSIGYRMPNVCTAAHLVIQSAPTSEPVPSKPVFRASRVSATHSGRAALPSMSNDAGAVSGPQVGVEGKVIPDMLPETTVLHMARWAR